MNGYIGWGLQRAWVQERLSPWNWAEPLSQLTDVFTNPETPTLGFSSKTWFQDLSLSLYSSVTQVWNNNYLWVPLSIRSLLYNMGLIIFTSFHCFDKVIQCMGCCKMPSRFQDEGTGGSLLTGKHLFRNCPCSLPKRHYLPQVITGLRHVQWLVPGVQMSGPLLSLGTTVWAIPLPEPLPLLAESLLQWHHSSTVLLFKCFPNSLTDDFLSVHPQNLLHINLFSFFFLCVHTTWHAGS